MSRDYNTYESPLCTRYASKEMQYVFSQQKKFGTFRRPKVTIGPAIEEGFYYDFDAAPFSRDAHESAYVIYRVGRGR